MFDQSKPTNLPQRKPWEPPTPASPPQGGGARGGGLEIPKKAVPKPKPKEPVIFTMPKDYVGKAPKAPVKKEVAPPPPKPPPTAGAPQAQKPPPPPPPPPPKPKPPKPGAPKKKKKIPPALIVGVLFLIVIGVGGFLLLRSIGQEAPAPPVNVEPPTPPPPPPPPPPTSEPEPVRPGIDTDSDGLTDAEERTIYNSNPRNPDTDNDTFIDGNEVMHLYSPTEGDNVTLGALGTSAMGVIEPPQGPYSFLYPRNWQVKSLAGGGEADLDIQAPTGEHIEIIVHDSVEPALLQGLNAFESKSGMQGLRNGDNRKVYLMHEDTEYVFELNYKLGTKRTIEFLRTFEMMVMSFFGTQAVASPEPATQAQEVPPPEPAPEPVTWPITDQEEGPSELMEEMAGCILENDRACAERLLQDNSCTDLGGDDDFVASCYLLAPQQMVGEDCMSGFFEESDLIALMCMDVNPGRIFSCDNEAATNYARQGCKAHNAFITGEMSWCADFVYGDMYISDCYGAIAARNNDASVCFSSNLMDSEGLNKYWGSCLISMASYKEDVSLCETFTALPQASELETYSTPFLEVCQSRVNRHLRNLERLR